MSRRRPFGETIFVTVNEQDESTWNKKLMLLHWILLLLWGRWYLLEKAMMKKSHMNMFEILLRVHQVVLILCIRIYLLGTWFW